MADSSANDIPKETYTKTQSSAEQEVEELRRLLLGTDSPSPPAGDGLDELRHLLLSVESSPSPEQAALTELRTVLVGPEQAQLAKLQARFDDPKLLAQDLSLVLPEAILLRASQDKKLVKALSPSMAEAIQTTVRKDPKLIVDILFPIIGSMIRKALASTLSGMIQSLNQTLDHSFSIQGLKWRFEARATGKSFAEVVFLHTLVYQVEEIFLIHKQTGIVLCHVTSKNATGRDPDLVSGMLTAIQDFVHDSFEVRQGETLETLRVGELNVWIEQGPKAVLAGVIRGNAPPEVKSAFQDAIEAIHLEQSDPLEAFQGETSPFEACRPQLELCLLSQVGEVGKGKDFKLSPAAITCLGLILVGVGIWGALSFQKAQKWGRFLATLQHEPGIVVTHVGYQNGKYSISGLCDPLARDPAKLLQEAQFDAQTVESHWEPYQSLYPQFILARAKLMLEPPESVVLELKNGTLIVSGTASHQWVMETKRLVKGIGGVTKLQMDQLIDTDTLDLDHLKARIEQQILQFPNGSFSPLPGQESTFKEVIADFQRVCHIAQNLGKEVQLEILGYTDSSGTDDTNLKLSQKRAEFVRVLFIQQGVAATLLQATGVGSNQPLSGGVLNQENELNRKVSFRVHFSEAIR